MSRVHLTLLAICLIFAFTAAIPATLIIDKLRALATLIRKSSKSYNEELLSQILSLEESTPSDEDLKEFSAALVGFRGFVKWHIHKQNDILEDLLKKIMASNAQFMELIFNTDPNHAVPEISLEREYRLLASEIKQTIALVKESADSVTSYMKPCSTFWEMCRTTMQKVNAVLKKILTAMEEQKSCLVAGLKFTPKNKQVIGQAVLNILKELDPYIKQFNNHNDL